MITACLFFCACGASLDHEHGIENYDKEDSHFGLNQCLLPSDDFVERFEYEDIDYHFRYYYDSFFSMNGDEETIMIIHYSTENYVRAKAYCLENMELAEDNIIELNGYIFTENIELNDSGPRQFPHWFNMFVYNDEQQCLAFLGFWGADYTEAEPQIIRENWDDFLARHFSNLYQFGD